MGQVLIIAFDGLDKELIERYSLTHIKQEEFGQINNSDQMTAIVTTELFASFITGKTWRKHGSIGLGKYKDPKVRFIERKINRYSSFKKFAGFRRHVYGFLPFFSNERTDFTKKDLQTETFFEKTSKTKAIDVPAYSTGYNVKLMDIVEEHGVEAAEKGLNRFTRWKKQDLLDDLENDYNLIMAHFHKPDHIHHWYWEVGKMDKVEETYHEMDEMAKEIKEKAEENGFDTIIFMSDHGLPDVEHGGHNENAFYSCNHELFPNTTPHITDFHDKILELVGVEEDDEDTRGIDV